MRSSTSQIVVVGFLILGIVVAYQAVLNRRLTARNAGLAPIDGLLREANANLNSAGESQPELAKPPDLATAIANPIVRQAISPFRFTDITAEAGIDFVHQSGMTAEKHFPTANGSGVAIFDYNNDGLMDLYFANATKLPLGTEKSGPNRLYKNLGNNRFVDATEPSGLGFRGFCHGIVTGDIDNDGDVDVFLANYGGNVLFENLGNGTFRDISKASRLDRSTWSSGGAFLDYDRDGDLDLYVSNYGEWVYPRDARFCTDETFRYAPGEAKVRIYCSPRTIKSVSHLLYRNDGNKTFTEVGEQAGVSRSDGRGFGVVASDINGDGWIDLFVANDMSPNFLFLNKGNGTFLDASESSGAALDSHGRALSGMGVNAEDLDGDGRPELFVTNFAAQSNTVYANLGEDRFEDITPTTGMAADSEPWVGWGCTLADFDQDGHPDCIVTNGHVDDNMHEVGRNGSYAQPTLLHRNVGDGKFQLATRGVGPYFDQPHVGRGLAIGDLDNDGDLDVVITHKDGQPAILRNDTTHKNHWIRFNLVGTRSGRDAVGTRLEVVAGKTILYRQRKGGTSLESSNDPRVLIGLGNAPEATHVTIRWPSGHVETREHLAANQTYTIVEPLKP